MHTITRSITLTVVFAILLAASTLSGFIPQRANFANDYQHQLFISWMERGGFDPRTPASLSQRAIKISYAVPGSIQRVEVECEMQNNRIVTLREIVPQSKIRTAMPDTENQYRYFLELILYRLNSDQDFFLRDLLLDLQISLSWNGEEIIPEDSLSFLRDKERFVWREFKFTSVGETDYKYLGRLYNDEYLEFIFPGPLHLVELFNASQRKEHYSLDIDSLRNERGSDYYALTSSYKYGTDISSTGRSSSIASSPYSPQAPDRNLPMREYIEAYRNQIWGREMLHNKVSNTESFLSGEFPYHSLSQSRSLYELKTPPFNNNISADIQLIKKSYSDGIAFEALENFTINSGKNVQLPTGETILLTDLNDQDIEIIAPYINQLLTMHRVMGSRLLNFLLIPADVPTILVLRDPERWVTEFDSYTDLILMLSYYWEKRTVYFKIEQVKKVNNYIEMNGLLVARDPVTEKFDFAEVRFALDRHYRIDLAMLSLYTNIKTEEE